VLSKEPAITYTPPQAAVVSRPESLSCAPPPPVTSPPDPGSSGGGTGAGISVIAGCWLILVPCDKTMCGTLVCPP
jgi:hypothetical protein